MSTKETKDKDTGMGAGESGRTEPGSPGKGSPSPTITNKRGFTVPAMPGANGGTLMVGNPGHDGSNAGRPKKYTRESLTEAAGQAAEPYVKLRDDWLRKAQEFLDAGDVDKADRCQKAADRIQEGYHKYGVGVKVTNVLERAEWISLTGSAFDRAAKINGLDLPEVRAELFRQLDLLIQN